MSIEDDDSSFNIGPEGQPPGGSGGGSGHEGERTLTEVARDLLMEHFSEDEIHSHSPALINLTEIIIQKAWDGEEEITKSALLEAAGLKSSKAAPVLRMLVNKGFIIPVKETNSYLINLTEKTDESGDPDPAEAEATPEATSENLLHTLTAFRDKVRALGSGLDVLQIRIDLTKRVKNIDIPNSLRPWLQGAVDGTDAGAGDPPPIKEDNIERVKAAIAELEGIIELKEAPASIAPAGTLNHQPVEVTGETSEVPPSEAPAPPQETGALNQREIQRLRNQWVGHITILRQYHDALGDTDLNLEERFSKLLQSIESLDQNGDAYDAVEDETRAIEKEIQDAIHRQSQEATHNNDSTEGAQELKNAVARIDSAFRMYDPDTQQSVSGEELLGALNEYKSVYERWAAQKAAAPEKRAELNFEALNRQLEAERLQLRTELRDFADLLEKLKVAAPEVYENELKPKIESVAEQAQGDTSDALNDEEIWNDLLNGARLRTYVDYKKIKAQGDTPEGVKCARDTLGIIDSALKNLRNWSEQYKGYISNIPNAQAGGGGDGEIPPESPNGGAAAEEPGNGNGSSVNESGEIIRPHRGQGPATASGGSGGKKPPDAFVATASPDGPDGGNNGDEGSNGDDDGGTKNAMDAFEGLHDGDYTSDTEEEQRPKAGGSGGGGNFEDDGGKGKNRKDGARGLKQAKRDIIDSVANPKPTWREEEMIPGYRLHEILANPKQLSAEAINAHLKELKKGEGNKAEEKPPQAGEQEVEAPKEAPEDYEALGSDPKLWRERLEGLFSVVEGAYAATKVEMPKKIKDRLEVERSLADYHIDELEKKKGNADVHIGALRQSADRLKNLVNREGEIIFESLDEKTAQKIDSELSKGGVLDGMGEDTPAKDDAPPTADAKAEREPGTLRTAEARAKEKAAVQEHDRAVGSARKKYEKSVARGSDRYPIVKFAHWITGKGKRRKAAEAEALSKYHQAQEERMSFFNARMQRYVESGKLETARRGKEWTPEKRKEMQERFSRRYNAILKQKVFFPELAKETDIRYRTIRDELSMNKKEALDKAVHALGAEPFNFPPGSPLAPKIEIEYRGEKVKVSQFGMLPEDVAEAKRHREDQVRAIENQQLQSLRSKGMFRRALAGAAIGVGAGAITTTAIAATGFGAPLAGAKVAYNAIRGATAAVMAPIAQEIVVRQYEKNKGQAVREKAARRAQEGEALFTKGAGNFTEAHAKYIEEAELLKKHNRKKKNRGRVAAALTGGAVGAGTALGSEIVGARGIGLMHGTSPEAPSGEPRLPSIAESPRVERAVPPASSGVSPAQPIPAPKAAPVPAPVAEAIPAPTPLAPVPAEQVRPVDAWAFEVKKNDTVWDLLRERFHEQYPDLTQQELRVITDAYEDQLQQLANSGTEENLAKLREMGFEVRGNNPLDPDYIYPGQRLNLNFDLISNSADPDSIHSEIIAHRGGTPYGAGVTESPEGHQVPAPARKPDIIPAAVRAEGVTGAEAVQSAGATPQELLADFYSGARGPEWAEVKGISTEEFLKNVHFKDNPLGTGRRLFIERMVDDDTVLKQVRLSPHGGGKLFHAYNLLDEAAHEKGLASIENYTPKKGETLEQTFYQLLGESAPPHQLVPDELPPADEARAMLASAEVEGNGERLPHGSGGGVITERIASQPLAAGPEALNIPHHELPQFNYKDIPGSTGKAFALAKSEFDAIYDSADKNPAAAQQAFEAWKWKYIPYFHGALTSGAAEKLFDRGMYGDYTKMMHTNPQGMAHMVDAVGRLERSFALMEHKLAQAGLTPPYPAGDWYLKKEIDIVQKIMAGSKMKGFSV